MIRSPIVIVSDGSFGNATTPLNTATTFAAFSIVGDGRTLAEVRFYLSAVAGTVDGTDVHAMLYSSSALHPASLVGSEDHTLSAGTIGGAGWYTITGFNTALTAGVHYWILFWNGNGTPATNYPTLRAVSSGTGPLGNDYRAWCWMYRVATGNADPNLATWGSNVFSAAGIRLGFSDASYAGLPVSAQAGMFKTYAGIKFGASFVAPASLRLTGISMFVLKAGSPVGTFRYDLYQDTTLIASTQTAAADEVGTGNYWVPLYFDSVQTLSAGVRYRVVLYNTDTSTDNSSNCFGGYGASFDTDSNSLALAPLGGTLQYAYYNGSAWSADSTATLIPVALLVESFPAASGGGATQLIGGGKLS